MTFWLQIAAVGGNQRGRTFFKQHGWTELGSDKIEQKVIAHNGSARAASAGSYVQHHHCSKHTTPENSKCVLAINSEIHISLHMFYVTYVT